MGCALQMGAIIAGADEKEQELIYQYGIVLGVAFQLIDDYLDAYGDPETFGKEVGGDIREKKKSSLPWSIEDEGCAELRKGLLSINRASTRMPWKKKRKR